MVTRGCGEVKWGGDVQRAQRVSYARYVTSGHLLYSTVLISSGTIVFLKFVKRTDLINVLTP